MTVSKTVYVARDKSSGRFACEGRETGMGRVIESTADVSAAKFCYGPGGIMSWMGGHYRRYDAVPVTITYESGEVVPYPPEGEVWPDDHSRSGL